MLGYYTHSFSRWPASTGKSDVQYSAMDGAGGQLYMMCNLAAISKVQ